jgi:hypothetical protein
MQTGCLANLMLWVSVLGNYAHKGSLIVHSIFIVLSILIVLIEVGKGR